ncbi:MAG TPA: glycoside hydrolase family 3 N-terminal domain-containing protein [Polyangiaceae bacterium]|nr:glycoside hydrolase family 3 N-terminal domain-containing protein [Polyangiaceae bacterium]
MSVILASGALVACGDDDDVPGPQAGRGGNSGTSGANGANGANGAGGASGANGANGAGGTSGSGIGGASGGGGTGGIGGANGAGGIGGANGTGGGGSGGAAAVEWPVVKSVVPTDPAIEQAVASLVASMTLPQKVGQMVQAEIQAITPAQVKQFHIGSVLNGGGSWPGGQKNATAADWVALADAYYNASTDTSGGAPGEFLGVPVIWGTDAVHGHNNVVGATLFPHNIGLGAANDPDLIERIGAITALEVAVTGLDWAFGPTLAVVRDDRWGRTYEGYSEDPEIVRSYGGRMVQGIQGSFAKGSTFLGGRQVVATAKHFLGDGGTDKGKDQGNNLASEVELRDIHAQGYLTALAAGSQAVMASFNSWQGLKMHGHRYLLTDVLKGRFGFDGVVVGDWNGHGQVEGCTDARCAAAINAGVDLIMVPNEWQNFIANTIADVNAGAIAPARIDDAVSRILRVKMRAGLLGPHATKGAPSTRPVANQAALLGAPDHRAAAREAVRKSLVLLKNRGGLLPLAKSAKVLVAGKSADNIANQSGGWTLSWQGTGNTNANFPGAQSIYAGISAALGGDGAATLSPDGSGASAAHDVAVVVIGETPYAEGQGDIGKLQTLEHAALHPEDLQVINAIRAAAPALPIVTVLLSGRPLFVNKELNRSDAFVAAWLPGSEGGGVADVLFGDHDFTGKLSFSWPGADCQTSINRGDGSTPLFPYGFGLTYADADGLGDDLSEAVTGHGCDAPTNPGGTTSDPLDVFVGGANRGEYVLRIGGPSNWGGVEVSPDAPTTLPGNEVTVTTIDGLVQGSAKRVAWAGTGQVYSQLADPDPGDDVTTYANSRTSISFRVKVDAAPQGFVNLSSHCVYPCLGEVPLTGTLQSIADGAWHEVQVPLQCLVADGLDITNVNTPFLIYTESAMTLSLEDIRWLPETAPANPDCTVYAATSLAVDAGGGACVDPSARGARGARR